MTDRSCPNCGAGLGDVLDRFRMTTCPSCGTSVILEDDRVTRAGEAGVLHDVPLLFALGETVIIGGAGWRTAGQARFSYGRGSWDEFWALDGAGRGAWISVDEGDVVLQAAFDSADWPALGPDAGLGARVTCRRRGYRVTEVETATCEALRGSLPEVLRVGESHRFLNLAGDEGDLLSGEFWEGGQAWFLGRWLDPFELRPGTASP